MNLKLLGGVVVLTLMCLPPLKAQNLATAPGNFQPSLSAKPTNSTVVSTNMANQQLPPTSSGHLRGLPPGVYSIKPYAGLVMVPNQTDAKMIHPNNPVPTNSMPALKPKLEAKPGQNTSP